MNEVSVTFTKNVGVYNEGESASFAADRAEALIKGGFAVKMVETKAKAKPD